MPKPAPLPSALTQVIATNLKMLADILGDAVSDLTEAQGYLDHGEQNAAIGTILGLEARLADAVALHKAVLVLHRQR